MYKTTQSHSQHMKDQSFSITAGSIFTGTVTQSGVMLKEGQHRYKAIQTCTLTIESISGREVVCEIRRVECEKFIDGSSYPRPQLPEYLRLYLTTRGSCVERATGVYDPFTGVMLLRGGEPVVVSKSCVQWSQHHYALVVVGRRITGYAFNIEERDDRVEEAGVIRVDAIE
jgi:hypothetical protein